MKHEQKICPRCGRLFECKLNNPVHCGCAAIELSEEIQFTIQNLYHDCLCSDCLRAIADSTDGNAQSIAFGLKKPQVQTSH